MDRAARGVALEGVFDHGQATTEGGVWSTGARASCVSDGLVSMPDQDVRAVFEHHLRQVNA